MDKQYSTKFARRIKDPDMLKSMTKEVLSNLFEVLKDDHRFVTHFRNNYFNIYYRSGSVAKVTPQGLVVDPNYFSSDEYEGQYEKVVNLYNTAQFSDYLNTMVKVMDAYWKKHNPEGKEDEGDVQQKISDCNKYGKSDFTVIDLEYQVSSDKANPLRYDGSTPYPGKKKTKDGTYKTVLKTQPRFDIVSVHDGQIFVIELKKGTGAMRHHAGIHDHIDSFLHTIAKSEETKALFVEEMSELLKQKQDLGLVDKRVKITSKDVQFCIAYSYKQPKAKRTREMDSINLILNKEENGIDPRGYQVIYLEPDDYTLKLE